jgi:predicted acyltransferase
MESIAKAPSTRLTSLDAYRGFVMLLMAGEVLRFDEVSRNLPDSSFWKLLAHNQSHVPWRGCTLHDLIQPSFSFLVGAALPWSIASRRSRGDAFGRMFLHTLWRALALSALGVILRSMESRQTNFTFEDTLSQIGFGYTFLWLLGWTKVRTQIAALAAILIGYWALFALWPIPGPAFDLSKVGVDSHWSEWMTGFAAHWNKNTNPAWAFDTRLLNLFPRENHFRFNDGGYSTLSFIPTLGTMIVGLLAGEWIRRSDVAENVKVRNLLIAGVVGLTLGIFCDLTHICPSVKRIWTPSWVLFSGGWCCLFLGTFYGIADVKKHSAWVFPLAVVGMNSIFMYVTSHLWEGFFIRNLRIHLGQHFWENVAGPCAPTIEGLAVLSIFWSLCYWLWRKRVFIRI